MAKIYVASSWRNPYQPEVVDTLRADGHEVFDFRHPWKGYEAFRWSDIDENWQDWTVNQYQAGLRHPVAEEKFTHDLEAMQWADVCVLILPCGRSAHAEAGWFAGNGKPVIVYIPEKQEPELMYKLFDCVVNSIDDIIETLSHSAKRDISTYDAAYKLAIKAHKGQVDKNGKEYILHPLRVALSLDKQEDKVVALLHDVLEDTNMSLEQILSEVKLSEEQVYALKCLTRGKSENTSDYMARIVTSKMAIRIKLADLHDNMDVSRFSEPLNENDVRMLNKFIYEQNFIKEYDHE